MFSLKKMKVFLLIFYIVKSFLLINTKLFRDVNIDNTSSVWFKLRNLEEYQDWNSTETKVFNNENPIRNLQSYYKLGETTFITYESEGSFFISIENTLYNKEITPYKYISEISKGLNNIYYVCLENSQKFYEINLDNIDSNARPREVFDESNDSIEKIVCRKSNTDGKLMIGYVGWSKFKIFAPAMAGSYPIYENPNCKLISLNFIYPQQDELIYIASLCFKAESSEYFLIHAQGYNSTSITQTQILVESRYASDLIKDNYNLEISLNNKQNFFIVLSYNSNIIDSASAYFHNFNGKTKYTYKLDRIIPGAKFESIKFIKMTELMTFKAVINNIGYMGVINLFARKVLFIKKNNAVTNLYFTSDITRFPSLNLVDDTANLLLANKDFISLLNCPFTYLDSASSLTCHLNCATGSTSLLKGILLSQASYNLCVDCASTENKYYEQGFCVSECSAGAVLKAETNECIICMNQEKEVYLQKRNITNTLTSLCVENCDTDYLPDSFSFECYMCKDKGQYEYDGVCNAQKPDFAQCNQNNICVICKKTDFSKYFFKDLKNDLNSRCLAKCEDNMIEKPDYICELCPEGYFKIDNDCVAQCPSYGTVESLELKICKTCKKEMLRKYLSNGQCLDTCEVNYFYDKYNICYKCADLPETPYMIEFSKQCVKSCPPGSEIDETKKLCYRCKDYGKFLSLSGTCVSECSKHELYTEYNECYRCQTKNKKYLFKGECTDKCPDYAAVDKLQHICYACKDDNKYLFDNECVEKCNDYYIYDMDNICHDCIIDNKNYFYFQNSCRETCPYYTRKDSNYKNFYCEDCKLRADNKTFYNPYSNTCEEKCSEEMFYEADKVCYYCKDKFKYFYKNKCLDFCPENTQLGDYKCFDCPEDKFIQNYFCVDACSKKYIYKENKICVRCAEFQMSTSDNTCVSTCPPGYKYDLLKLHCDECKKLDNKVLFKDTQCINREECLPRLYYFNEKNNTCVDCKDINKYHFHGVCIDNCDISMFAKNETLKMCYNCTLFPDKPYLDIDTSTCVSSCASNKELRGSKCVNCKKENKFLLDGKCENQCTDYHLINYTLNTCLECNSDNSYYFYDENKCIPNCNYNYTQNARNMKKCSYYNICQKTGMVLFRNKTSGKDECITECPEGYEKSNKDECIACVDKEGKNYYKYGTCVFECGKRYSYNDKKICRYCEYIYNNTCVENCSQFYKIKNPDTHICENCPDYKYFYNGGCKASCPPKSTPDYEKWTCINETIIPISCLDDPSSNDFSIRDKCQCKDSSKTKGKYCNIEVIGKQTDKSFYLESHEDENDDNYYIFEIIFNKKIDLIKIRNANETTPYIEPKGIIEVIWAFNKIEKIEFKNFKTIRIRKDKFDFLPNEDSLTVSATVKSNNLTESAESKIVFPGENMLKGCLKFEFEEILNDRKDENIFINDVKILHKIKTKLDDSSCKGLSLYGLATSNNINLKYFYLDSDNKKIKLTNNLNFTIYKNMSDRKSVV